MLYDMGLRLRPGNSSRAKRWFSARLAEQYSLIDVSLLNWGPARTTGVES